MERKKVIKNYSMGKKDFRESFLCGFERREDQVCVCARVRVLRTMKEDAWFGVSFCLFMATC